MRPKIGPRNLAVLILAACTLFGLTNARAAAVVLELVLAVDVSGSVSAERYALQRQGYAAAFRDPRVVRSIANAGGIVAVTMTQWTGPTMQVQVVPWTHVSDAGSAGRLADAIEAAARQLFSGGTSVSGAIDHAVRLMSDSPHAGIRRVIDVSGDGANNRGRPAAEARDAAISEGIVINGLPILALDHTLDAYYRDNVIGGPGAFMIAAETYESFAEAIVRKLVLEISGSDGGASRQAENLLVNDGSAWLLPGESRLADPPVTRHVARASPDRETILDCQQRQCRKSEVATGPVR